MVEVISPTKLIEAAMPLEAINAASAREKSIRHGHPSTLHLWWARRPLAAARAVIFAQMVDDPSSNPEAFPTEKSQEKERERLFDIIRRMVPWDSTTDESVMEEAREEIRKSWRRTCELNKDHPDAAKFFDPEKLPPFHDPFAGGGALPLEAQRLGLEAHASDLNPVAVLINKAMIEIPPKFAGQPPVNPESRNRLGHEGSWKGASGLAEDVRYYGQWMRDEAEKRIGHLYPKVEITEEMASERPDLKPYVGRKLTVIAWLWARTVKSPNPAFSDVDVPLASTFMLSTKKGNEAYVQPIVEGRSYRFEVLPGNPPDVNKYKQGTKLARGANFECLLSGSVIGDKYIKSESMAGRIGSRLMAIVVEGDRGRVYLSPIGDHEAIANASVPDWKPESPMNRDSKDLVSGRGYGYFSWSDLFTPRQLIALNTFFDLVAEVRDIIREDCRESGFSGDGPPLRENGAGSQAYSEALSVYLSFAVDKCADYWSSMCSWAVSRETLRNTFGRQAIPMVWDFTEGSPFCSSTGNWGAMIDWVWKTLQLLPGYGEGEAVQLDAARASSSAGKVVSSDPPYYDNIGYADLSDFFYVWLRRGLSEIYPDLFTTVAVPKAGELIASTYRQGGKQAAEKFFINGMTSALSNIAESVHPGFPATIYYAFKQSEIKSGDTTRTGWATFLEALISTGFMVSGTWPTRTERPGRMISVGTNALASSIVLVCRKRPETSSLATRGEFVTALRTELASRIALLKSGNISPVDLPQSSIGPGIEIFTRYSKVLEQDGTAMTVGTALSLIDQIRGELEAEQGELDEQTRWAIAWFEMYGTRQGQFGDADNLARASNTAVNTLEGEGIVESGGGKIRLYRADELDPDWDQGDEATVTVWEATHHLVRALDPTMEGGSSKAGELLASLGGETSDKCKDLAYRLYSICETNGWTESAMSYNGLVQSWPDILSAARDIAQAPVQTSF